MSIDNFLRLWIFCCCCGSEIFSTIMLKYFFWFLNEIFFSLVLKCYFLLELYIFYRGGDNLSQKSHSSSGGGYQVMTNGHGHSGGVSPNSSQLSMDTGRPEQTLVSRTQKQHVTHNVRTKSKYFYIEREGVFRATYNIFFQVN